MVVIGIMRQMRQFVQFANRRLLMMMVMTVFVVLVMMVVMIAVRGSFTRQGDRCMDCRNPRSLYGRNRQRTTVQLHLINSLPQLFL